MTAIIGNITTSKVGQNQKLANKTSDKVYLKRKVYRNIMVLFRAKKFKADNLLRVENRAKVGACKMITLKLTIS